MNRTFNDLGALTSNVLFGHVSFIPPYWTHQKQQGVKLWTVKLPGFKSVDASIKDKKFDNNYIRKILTADKSVPPIAMVKWKQALPSFFFPQKIWSDITKYIIPNEVKETNFQILHRYYPCNDFISEFKEGFVLFL